MNSDKATKEKKLSNVVGCSWITTMLLIAVTASANVVEEDDAIEKQWRNAAVISHPYTSGLDSAGAVVTLAANDLDQPVFEVMPRLVMTNEQPARSLWTLEVEENTKFFKLKNLSTDQYLVRVPASSQVSLVTSVTVDDEHADWFIQSFTNHGDLAVYNRSGEQQYALILDSSQSALMGDELSVSLATVNDLHSTEHLLRLDSRFLEVALTTVDITEGTCLVRLANGAPMEGFFTPSPASGSGDSVTRQFRVNILGSESDPYSFVNDIGFDPLSSSLSMEQEEILEELREDIGFMRLVVEENLDSDEVFESFMEQLSDAFVHEDSATIVYFPESQAQLEFDELAGTITKDFVTLADKSLAMRITVHNTLSSSYSYAFLVEEYLPDGSVDFSFVDPTDSSKPSRPR